MGHSFFVIVLSYCFDIFTSKVDIVCTITERECIMKLFNKCSKIIISTLVAVNVFMATAVPTFAAGNKHTVTFMYGTKVYQTVVDDGCTALPPTDTYVPGYIFAGWVGQTTNVKSDMTILGAYAKVEDQAPAQQAPATSTEYYDVKFVDGLTGAQYYSERVPKGGNLILKHTANPN